MSRFRRAGSAVLPAAFVERQRVCRWAYALAFAWLVAVACVLQTGDMGGGLPVPSADGPQRGQAAAVAPAQFVHHLSAGPPVALAAGPVAPLLPDRDRRTRGARPDGPRGALALSFPPRPDAAPSTSPETAAMSPARPDPRSGSLVAASRAPPLT